MTIDEIKTKLRKKHGFFECPKKKDRIFLTEQQWSQIDWTDEEKFINAALPHKLWNMRHDDHLWPWCQKFRGEDAKGYRAGEGHPKYMPQLPTLVKGRGISRWMSHGDASVIEVPAFASFHNTWTLDNIPEVVEFYERNPGHPDYKKGLIRWSKKNFLRIYAPSALQKFSKRSYLERTPKHISWHYLIKKNEVIGIPKDQTGADLVALYRRGFRWDSYDGYFIEDAFYTGLRWN